MHFKKVILSVTITVNIMIINFMIFIMIRAFSN